MKIRRGDEVIVLSGKDKNKRGQVLKVFTKSKELRVQGIALAKKHVKPNPNLNIEGGIVTKERRIPASKVAIFNNETGKADRIGFRFENGKKVRYFKSNNNLLME